MGHGVFIFELREHQWVNVGNQASSIACENSELRCYSIDDSIWVYEGTPHQWGFVRKKWEGTMPYQLKMQLEGEVSCLESGPGGHGRGAHTDTCKSITVQTWHMVPAGPNTYRLKTVYRGENECLDAADDGGVLMNACTESSSQLWELEEDKEGYVLFKTQDRGKGVCLKGNEPNSSLREVGHRRRTGRESWTRGRGVSGRKCL